MKLFFGVLIVLAGFVVVFPWEDVVLPTNSVPTTTQATLTVPPTEQAAPATNTVPSKLTNSIPASDAVAEESKEQKPESVKEQTATLPAEVNLVIPFTPQAPHANWSLPYQEACEEAAALMVHWFWEQSKSSGKAGSGSAGQKAQGTSQKSVSKSKEEADAGILDLVDFQEEHYGFYKDTGGEETARFIRDRWGHTVDVVYDPTVAMIKQEVADGFPIIVLAAGRQLKNPYYTPPGPIYHALVIKGYTADGLFITNDAGTRRGADYRYQPSALMNALHEWNGGKIESGRRVMIIVRR